MPVNNGSQNVERVLDALSQEFALESINDKKKIAFLIEENERLQKVVDELTNRESEDD